MEPEPKEHASEENKAEDQENAAVEEEEKKEVNENEGEEKEGEAEEKEKVEGEEEAEDGEEGEEENEGEKAEEEGEEEANVEQGANLEDVQHEEFGSEIKQLPPNVTPAMLKSIMASEVAHLKAMKPAEFVQQMEELKQLHDQIYIAAEKFIKRVIAQIPQITPVLKKVSEYDQQACDRVLEATDDDWRMAGINAEERENIIDMLEERMAESVQVNFDFTHEISYIAGPLTVWRLNACTAVWAGNNEIVNAHKVTAFVFDDPDAKRKREEDEEAEAAAAALAEKARLEEEARRKALEAEEAERARLEAEAHIEGQLDPEEIAASERPPLKEWSKYVYTVGEGEDMRVICYVRAPPDCLVSEDRLICSFGDALAEWPNLPGNSEAIGKFVCIKPSHPKRICILPDEPWIVGIPHKYGKNPTREVVVFSMDADEFGPPKQTLELDETDEAEADAEETTQKLPWIDLQTTDVAYEDSRYLEIKLTRLGTAITLAPAARIRRDSVEVGRAGGKLNSLVDKRVVLVVPPMALKITCIYSIQVQPISQHHAHLLRDQNLAFMSQFTACSPLILLTGPKKILFKMATWTLPLTDANPSTQVVIMSTANMPEAFTGRRKTKGGKPGGPGGQGQPGDSDDDNDVGSDADSQGGGSPRELDPFQRSLLLPKLLAGANSSHAEVALMYSGLENSNWKVWENVEFVETKNVDVCVFNCRRLLPRKIMAIQTRTVVDNDSLIHMAQVLERSLSQRIVYACLRQNKAEPGRICFALCLTRDLDTTLNQMAAKGYTEGGKPIGPLFIYERQTFDIIFKGNVRPKKQTVGRSSGRLVTDKGKVRITFNTSLRNEYVVDVEECDPSAQVACEKYRGFIEISYKQKVKVPVKRGKGQQNRSGPMKKFVMETQTVLLCQLLITLPKKSIEQVVDEDTISYHFQPNDAVTDEFIKNLARKLPGESWRRLGIALDMSRTQLQAIGGRAESSGRNKALTTLKTWIKNLELRVDRVAKLKAALMTIGRGDLASELQMARERRGELTVTSSVSSETPPLLKSASAVPS
ncbi:unnamed protein product [Mesocestoides corti]|uniref:Death domain-containing protein n=4 Tax=Mesocestoides corti TaxID=53468 RepID=A0A158QU26_MESCO|nr:unnamed protein product [Mesocestoides corti]